MSFGVGGVILTATVFPLINFILPDGRVKNLYCQRVIHLCFKFFIFQMIILGIMKVEVKGLERLKNNKTKLIFANHPTLIDVVMLISVIENTNCIVKQGLWKNPFLKGAVKAAGYISNNDSESLIEDCVLALKRGDNLMIFPEGTRTIPGNNLRFQRGAAHIAVRSGASIIPVIITCDPPTLTKSEKWYQIPPRPFHLRLEVDVDIEVKSIIDENKPAPLISRQLTSYLENYFTERLSECESVRA